MNVVISSPYALDSLHGNTISAARIADILHARKSHVAIKAVKEQHPDARVILYLTGTDLYRDMVEGCGQCTESLELADAVVVSQEASLNSIPQTYQEKAVVVYNSISLPEQKVSRRREKDLFVVASHMRAVKQPFMVVDALAGIDDAVRVKLMGAEIDEGSTIKAREKMLEDERFEYLGTQDYADTIAWMSRSVATINTSLAEGGANSVGESIVLGVPVLASRIEGNIGMLGEDYAGYFSADSATELGELMHRVCSDEVFLAKLEQQVQQRSKKYSRENERKGWLALL